jgi:acyl-CoA synthetase (AMP-forming)/AMP-acid ligase II
VIKTNANINLARALPRVPHTKRLQPWNSISDLLNYWAGEKAGNEYLAYFDSDGQRHRFSYAEFNQAVNNLAAYISHLGLVSGDRIAGICGSHFSSVIQMFAAWRLGIVYVPLNSKEDDDRISFILEDAGVLLVFCNTQSSQRLKRLKLANQALDVLQICDFDLVPHALTVKMSQSATVPDPEILDCPAMIVYTSGTTGNPKGVVLSQYNLLLDAAQIASWHNIGEDSPMMCVLPIHHVNGIVVTLLTPLFAGSRTVLNYKFQSSTFFQLLQKEKIQIVSVVPTLLAFLLDADKQSLQQQIELPYFSHIICGAGPLTVDLAIAFEKHFSLRIVHGYGLSETTCYSCFLPVSQSAGEQYHWLADYGFPSIGLALPSNQMEIHDDDGQPVGENTRGEIVIRGHNVMLGYYRNDLANTTAFTGGWFHSGDEGFYVNDSHGQARFFITGRLKELIIRGGVNVSPLEIDEVLMNLPGVKVGIAVGFENNMYGEEIGAYVVLQAGISLSAENLLASCMKVLPHHKCPKVIVFGTDIPVTSTGKYQRNKLKALFSEWQNNQFSQNRNH